MKKKVTFYLNENREFYAIKREYFLFGWRIFTRITNPKKR